jgi:hypothetical protein
MRIVRSRNLMWAYLVLQLGVACGKDAKPVVDTGRDSTPNGLGEVCTSDADCEGDLKCRLDTTDPTNYQLCSADCTSDTDCQTMFADYTVCTGVHSCAVTCDTDNDCIQGTICDSRDTCQRGGPGSGVQTCEGTIEPCSSVASQSACEAAFCTWNGTCNGAPTPCSALTTAEACMAMTGCSWFATLSKCDGTTQTCSYYQTEQDCLTHGGDCLDAVTNCATLTRLDWCLALQGCDWSSDAGSASCIGTPTAQGPSCGCSWTGSCTGTSRISSCEEAGLTYCATTPGCHLVTQ